MSEIIKSSSHTTKYANTGKHLVLAEFLREYDSAIWWFVDYLWNTRIEWDTGRIMDITRGKLDVPTYISTPKIPHPFSELSARALKLAAGEAIGMIKSRTSKRRKQLYVLSMKMKEAATNKTEISHEVKYLQSKIDSDPLNKPKKRGTANYASFDSNCCTFIPTPDGLYDGFLKLSSLGKKYGVISIPVDFTKHSNRFAANGFTRMSTWQIGVNDVKSRWKSDVPKTIGTKIIGADQGYLTCLTLSDGQATGKCIHGHDLPSIIKRMTRKMKGSKGFKRAQAHRTNYINMVINQLNFTDVKELRLEKLRQMRTGVASSAIMIRWTYAQINAQVISRCEQLGVRVIEQSATYRSQRCSSCGWTHKASRVRKEFICTHCGIRLDADLNGAQNHEADLYQLPFAFWQLKLNSSGFFWNNNGIFNLAGQALTVPVVTKL